MFNIFKRKEKAEEFKIIDNFFKGEVSIEKNDRLWLIKSSAFKFRIEFYGCYNIEDLLYNWYIDEKAFYYFSSEKGRVELPDSVQDDIDYYIHKELKKEYKKMKDEREKKKKEEQKKLTEDFKKHARGLKQ